MLEFSEMDRLTFIFWKQYYLQGEFQFLEPALSFPKKTLLILRKNFLNRLYQSISRLKDFETINNHDPIK